MSEELQYVPDSAMNKRNHHEDSRLSLVPADHINRPHVESGDSGDLNGSCAMSKEDNESSAEDITNGICALLEVVELKMHAGFDLIRQAINDISKEVSIRNTPMGRYSLQGYQAQAQALLDLLVRLSAPRQQFQYVNNVLGSNGSDLTLQGQDAANMPFATNTVEPGVYSGNNSNTALHRQITEYEAQGDATQVPQVESSAYNNGQQHSINRSHPTQGSSQSGYSMPPASQGTQPSAYLPNYKGTPQGQKPTTSELPYRQSPNAQRRAQPTQSGYSEYGAHGDATQLPQVESSACITDQQHRIQGSSQYAMPPASQDAYGTEPLPYIPNYGVPLHGQKPPTSQPPSRQSPSTRRRAKPIQSDYVEYGAHVGATQAPQVESSAYITNQQHNVNSSHPTQGSSQSGHAMTLASQGAYENQPSAYVPSYGGLSQGQNPPTGQVSYMQSQSTRCAQTTQSGYAVPNSGAQGPSSSGYVASPYGSSPTYGARGQVFQSGYTQQKPTTYNTSYGAQQPLSFGYGAQPSGAAALVSQPPGYAQQQPIVYNYSTSNGAQQPPSFGYGIGAQPLGAAAQVSQQGYVQQQPMVYNTSYGAQQPPSFGYGAPPYYNGVAQMSQPGYVQQQQPIACNTFIGAPAQRPQSSGYGAPPYDSRSNRRPLRARIAASPASQSSPKDNIFKS